jgi:hypothetical protein
MAGGHHFMMTPPGDALIAYALPGTRSTALDLHPADEPHEPTN